MFIFGVVNCGFFCKCTILSLLLQVNTDDFLSEMENIKQNSLRAWILAARPKTLTGAAVPVMIALALAFADGVDSFNYLSASLCMLFAFIMQIDANFINDYFDFLKGNDDETRLGPERACSMGWVTAEAMKKAIAITTVIACAVGLPLIFYGGWEMILVGIICVIFCFLYTTHLSYRGLGDVLVLVFFGIVPVCVTYYIQLHTVTVEVFIASLCCGFVIDTLLIVNNFRDIDNDRRKGKNTLIVRVGKKGGLVMYQLAGLIPFIAGIMYVNNGRLAAFALPIIYIILHTATYRKMKRIDHGKELNMVLGDTARNMFIYGLLVSVGVIFSHIY